MLLKEYTRFGTVAEFMNWETKENVSIKQIEEAIKKDLDRLEEIKKIVDRTFPHDMVEGMKQIKQLLEKE